jgi:hypothetical protein
MDFSKKVKEFDIRKFRPWYFLVLALISGIIAVFALRSNNLHMASLRSKVYAADKNNGNVELALKNLQTYVTHHMNTSLTSSNSSVYPPIQLKYTYQRLVRKEENAANASHIKFYTKAQHYCEARVSGYYGTYRISCVEHYLANHGIPKFKLSKLKPIPAGLYQFSFASPAWSPDLAGFSLLAVVVFVAAFVVTFAGRLLRKFRHR